MGKTIESLKIKASAGTGKTFTIRKISADLVANEIPLTRVLFVTYTEKAAGEMRDRIRKEMEECYAKNDDKKRLYERACQDVDIAMIGTIHSFCRKVLHDFAYESNMPLEMSNIDDSAAESLIDQLVRDEWEQEICDHPKLFGILDADEISQGPNKKATIKDLLKNALKSYQPGMDIILPPTNFLEWLENNSEAKKNWEILQKHSSASFSIIKNGKIVPNKKVSALISKMTESRGVLVNANSFGASPAEADSEDLMKALEFFYNSPKMEFLTISERTEWAFFKEKLPKLYKKWQEEKAKRRAQSFNDMVYSVREAVCPQGKTPQEPTPLCKKIRETYDIAIIDEFQDTNALQWDIFRTVFLEDPEHKIIVVGDPKQSIYSFQGADLNVYNSAIDCIDGSKSLDFNFRSSKAMINACNTLFCLPNGLDDKAPKKQPFFKLEKFTPSKIPLEVKDQRQNALLNGTETEPVWISPKLSEQDFARFATKAIIDCCKVTDGHTALQIYERGESTPKNVKFSDFAVLVTKRSESYEIKKCLAEVGIPFIFYKDTELFSSRECSEWLALLKLLIAPNLSGYNQKILKSALVTDFFRIGLDNLDDERFDNPSDPIIEMINSWRGLGTKGLWTELQEEIYEKSKIEDFLSNSEHLQELARLRQIGNYIFTYLYEKRASLQQAIRHLEGLISNSKQAEDEDGNIVAKGTDFDAVQLMTIHASKGLEFPVVISCAGLRQQKNNPPGPFLFDEKDGTRLTKKLGFDKFSKRKRQSDEVEEWHRLVYVDYTRASSLLILPQFDKWYNDAGDIDKNNKWEFLAKAHRDFIGKRDYEGKTLAIEKPWNGKWDKEKMGEEVQKEKDFFNQATSDETSIPDTKEFRNILKSSGLYQHSYSSINKKTPNKSELLGVDGGRENDEDEAYLQEDLIDNTENTTKDNYPRGTLLGNAIHHIFEKLDFELFGQMSLEDAQKDVNLRHLIEREFIEQSLAIKKNPSWTDKTIGILWNTLNAVFPEITNASKTGKTFQLKAIKENCRLAEMDFRMNASDSKDADLTTYSKGSIDLVFVQDIGGEKRYSILDWKTNLLPAYDEGTVEKEVHEEYPIQLILYSYCLVEWLCCIYKEKSLEDAFNKYFGGAYYVFVRGCEAGTGKGIYAHIWKNFKELQDGYDKVKELMFS